VSYVTIQAIGQLAVLPAAAPNEDFESEEEPLR